MAGYEAYGTRLGSGEPRSAAWGLWAEPRIKVLLLVLNGSLFKHLVRGQLLVAPTAKNSFPFLA